MPWADLKNPQSLNLYSYVHNNPTSFADPDGHDCVVQTRTNSNTETVTVSSGNCNNVNVGEGQTKTYVPGTVDASTIKNDGQGGITFNFKPYDGSAAGSGYAPWAPAPEHPGIAYNWGNNAQEYHTLSQASKTVDRIAGATAIVAGGFGCAIYCAEAAAAIGNGYVASQEVLNAGAIRIMTFLESKGIPATAAAAMALKAMSRVGTQPRLGQKIELGRDLMHLLNQMVREYLQSH